MAYFNAPFNVPNHEQKAVECALDMQHSLREWRKVSEEKGVPPLKVRIGIHTGEVVVGDVGAKDQVGYTAIGDVVNTAARLEPLNKEFGTEILISEEVRSHLGDSIETQFVGELAIRGREEGIRAYSVTGRKATSQKT
jgi:adenylate cyclase